MSLYSHHAHYLRFHEGLNILTQEIDRIRGMHQVSEKYALPASRFFQQEFTLDEIITLLGLSLLKDRYLELLGEVDKHKPVHRPKLRENHLSCLAQVESMLGCARQKVSQVGDLHVCLDYHGKPDDNRANPADPTPCNPLPVPPTSY